MHVKFLIARTYASKRKTSEESITYDITLYLYCLQGNTLKYEGNCRDALNCRGVHKSSLCRRFGDQMSCEVEG